MNSIELLKHELAEQKSSIEAKGGFVTIANTSVSPSEITAGIKSIPSSTITDGTATESDVLQGKTFYAGNNTLKTGTLIIPSTSDSDKDLIDYVLFGKTSNSYPNLEIHLPQESSHVKEYLLYDCQCKADVYFNENIQTVGDMAFYQGVDTTIHDLDRATALTTVGLNAFRGVKGVDLSNLPSSITTLENYAFAECARNSNRIVLPGSITSTGSYCFNCETKATVDSIDISNLVNCTFGIYFFGGIKCLSDFYIPEGVTTLANFFNYDGSMKSVTFPTTFTKLNASAFNAKDTTPLEDLITEHFTFLPTKPPSITSNSLCLRLRDRTNFKIYVPDESIDSYKAVTALYPFLSYIFPISQKP